MFENKLPLKFDFIDGDKDGNITLRIEARRAKISDNAETLKTNNVWRYIREGGIEEVCKKHPEGHCNCLLETNIGPIVNVTSGNSLTVNWVNTLGGAPDMMGMAGMGGQLEPPPFPPVPMKLMDGMNPSVGVVTHLHGAKTEPENDGWPLDPLSFQHNTYIRNADSNRDPGKPFPTQEPYTYTNKQRAAMLWFHDHGMDDTGPQVHAGLAGLYFIRDCSDAEIFDLIDPKNNGNKVNQHARELPLAIQDRYVDCDNWHVNYMAGRPYTNTLGLGDSLLSSAYDRPEFLGETIFVNGRPWPHLDLPPNVHRLRVLNGSNARTYALALIDPKPWAIPSPPNKPKVWHGDLLTVIGNDGGLFPKSQTLAATDYILLAPGERLDLLLDLTGVDKNVTGQLRLVNLAVSYTNTAAQGPEPIFQTENAINAPGNAVASYILQPAPKDEFDKTLLASISQIKPANIMQFCIGEGVPGRALDTAKLDDILGRYAADEGFTWDAGNNVLAPTKTDPAAKNRFVVLMNDIAGLKPARNVYTNDLWEDTQIWEMASAKPDDNSAFQIPFTIDLDSATPPRGDVSATAINYKVARYSWFKPGNFQPVTSGDGYWPLQEATIKPSAGSYERWYVANLGNTQPLTVFAASKPNTVPDMHPFHIHLVNFVVLRRFVLNPLSNQFTPVTHSNTFDGQIRHDTVRIQSNELLELLVYFPAGYSGKYPFHCHIVEHEDMGMMSHFEVTGN